MSLIRIKNYFIANSLEYVYEYAQLDYTYSCRKGQFSFKAPNKISIKMSLISGMFKE